MASVSMAVQMTISTHNRVAPPSSAAFFNPLPVKLSKASFLINPTTKSAKFQTQASLKEKAVTGLKETAQSALTTSMVVPHVEKAVGSDVSPSLKNFLLSIIAGGVVLSASLGAIVGVSYFDPMKRE